MTTSQTIDGVPRELLEQLVDPVNHIGRVKARAELRALLDGPALELVEPVAPWFYFVECDDPDYSGLYNHENEAQTQANDHGGEVIKLWNVPPTWKPAVQPERVALRDIIAQAIGGDAYDCTRVWSAWGVGTMSDDDFIPIVDQEERLYEIADACLDELTRLNTKSR